MNNIKKERTLRPLALMATVVFAVLTLFCLLGFVVFVIDTDPTTTDMMLMTLCWVCMLPALGFYYSFSRQVVSDKKRSIVIFSMIACLIADVIFIIVTFCVKASITDDFSIFGIDPAITYILAVFTGQFSYFALFFVFGKKEKTLFDFLCIPVAAILPFLAFAASVIILVVVAILFVVAVGKGFVKFSNAIGAGQSPTRNIYTVNDGGRTYTLTYYQRNLVHNADEYRDEYNQAWITDDGGRTFSRI
ncbi:MAG: hypothetical protein IJW60_06385 [Clostridia bacterium]|nr:hypothetical protein [Clostridia bacterium]